MQFELLKLLDGNHGAMRAAERLRRAEAACYVNGKERDSLLDQLHATSPDGLERVVRGAARRVDDEISTLWAGTATRVRALASCTAASLTIRARSAVLCAGFVDGLLVLGRRAPGSSSAIASPQDSDEDVRRAASEVLGKLEAAAGRSRSTSRPLPRMVKTGMCEVLQPSCLPSCGRKSERTKHH